MIHGPCAADLRVWLKCCVSGSKFSMVRWMWLGIVGGFELRVKKLQLSRFVVWYGDSCCCLVCVVVAVVWFVWLLLLFGLCGWLLLFGMCGCC